MLILCVLWALAALPAAAQWRQYTPPGGPDSRDTDPETVIEQEMENARWNLGPLRLSPWFGINQLAYVDDVFAGSGSEEESFSDFNAVVGAGLTGYLPSGSDTYWVFDLTPEYIYWQDLSERRLLAGRYGAGFFGFYNRLQIQATAGRQESQRTFSAEFPQPTVLQEDHVTLDAALRLTGKLSLEGRAESRRIRDQSDEFEDPRQADFAALDRDEQSVRVGLRFRPSERVGLFLGAEDSELDSTSSARDLSNEGTSPVIGLDLEGGRSSFNVELAQRDLEPIGASEFGTYDEVSGFAQAFFEIGWRLDLRIYGSKTPVLSLLPEYAYYDEQRVGVALGSKLGRRARLEIFADQGENRYERRFPTAPERTDDLTSFGAELRFEITKSLALTVRAEDSQYDSSVPGQDRDVFNVRTGLALSADRLLWR